MVPNVMEVSSKELKAGRASRLPWGLGNPRTLPRRHGNRRRVENVRPLLHGDTAMDAAAQTVPPHYSFEEKRRRIFAIMAASSGNLVEWFDFYVYAFTSIYFAPSFFPKSNDTVQLLQTAAVFAIGSLMRPIGGWMFGRIADRKGRKTSLVRSVLLMCFGSLMIACLPTYDAIGLMAPLLLLIARMIQGLSVGGEYGTTATYMSEVALRGKRGFYSS